MNHYSREIVSVTGAERIEVDVYSVLVAFSVTCPAVSHAAKKLLCAGSRGHKDRVTDLKEAIAAIVRAIELEQGRA
jgi:hypothetical protein